jgi:hypothetical protein
MCMFCAAVPAAAAVGAKLNARQISSLQAAEKMWVQPPAGKPIAKMTLGAVVFLIVCSAVYHTVLSPLWNI